MKFFAVLFAVLAVAIASPATWSIHELSAAIQNPSTDPHLLPLLENALNDLMAQTFTGGVATTTTVSSVVQDFSAWTLHELSEAIQDPTTDPALLPYLEHGLNNIMYAIMSGQQQEFVIIGTPIGLLPIEATVPVVPAEAAVVPVVPAEAAVVPAEAAVVPAVSASPLVQIIVNVNSQEASAPLPTPVVVPSPIVPSPVVLPTPPSPVVVPSPVVLPAPVAPEVTVVEPVVVSPGVNPIDVIAVNPISPSAPLNPIDVIAISAPEINPVDLLSPIPVVTPVVGAVDVVGPLV